jgi:hypothetical protein
MSRADINPSVTKARDQPMATARPSHDCVPVLRLSAAAARPWTFVCLADIQTQMRCIEKRLWQFTCLEVARWPAARLSRYAIGHYSRSWSNFLCAAKEKSAPRQENAKENASERERERERERE